MSYSIRYGGKEYYSPKDKQKRNAQFLFGVMLIIAAMTVHAVWPETGEFLRQMLFPGASDSLTESFAVFSESIEAGESLGSALNTFCMDVVNDARKP